MNVREALREVASTLRQKLSAGELGEPGDYTFKFPPHGDPEHLEWMLDQIVENYNTWPIDKSSRWLGFVQGMMVAQSWITVEEERDRTRPIFHEAYKQEGIKVPERAGK